MHLEERSLSSQHYRPHPEVFSEQDTIITVTPWGARSYARQNLLDLKAHLQAKTIDPEMTNPYGSLDGLADPLHQFRLALLSLNENILQNQNSEEWHYACEVALIKVEGSCLFWASVGQPHILIQRPNMFLQPINYVYDWSTQFSPQLSPLPTDLLGTMVSPMIRFGSFVLQKEDEIVLISRSHLSANSLKTFASISDLTQNLTEKSELLPSWLGISRRKNIT